MEYQSEIDQAISFSVKIIVIPTGNAFLVSNLDTNI